ncbi:MAG: recombination regulator RecX [Undibacterium sp.]|nr:recombination regulator RecX [Undibacterium sp.]
MFKQKISLKARALRYLSMREHSRVELARKLAGHVQEDDDLEAVLDFLENANYLSDQRFSESLVNRRQARFGNQKILAELQSHQLSKDDMAALKCKLEESEGQRAINVLHRKFPRVACDSTEKAKQMKFLMQRGFSSSAINVALRASRDLDDLISPDARCSS